MIYVIYIFGGLFIVLACTMMYVYSRRRHFGMFLLAVIYGMSGAAAIALPRWWPLVAGFVLAWVLRLLGLEPNIEPPAGEENPESLSEGNRTAETRREAK
jgi:hypothetical protein